MGKILEKADFWIKFPTTEAEVNVEKEKWMASFQFENCIGAIDCTHIRIKKPGPTKNGDEYINRKGFASINVQATCNSEERFTSVCAKFPGSVHDSRIFKNSTVYSALVKTRSFGHYLIGDSGYALQPWLITPFKSPKTENEKFFNKIYAKDRVIIERVFGQLKSRFPMLGNILRIKLSDVSTFIISGFVLHNVAKFLQDPDFDFEPTPNMSDLEATFAPATQSSSTLRAQGNRRRSEILGKLLLG